jgi:hypothetical protein
MQLLSKGLEYNLHCKHKYSLEALALYVETARSKLGIIEQHYTYVVAKTMKKRLNEIYRFVTMLC